VNHCGLESQLNKLFSVGSAAPKVTAWAVVLLTLSQLGWLQLQPGSALKSIPGRVRNPALALAQYQDCDALAAQSGQANIFIHLVGCPKESTNAEATHSYSDYRESFLSLWYFRTTYDLYPRRAFIAPPDTIINGGWDLMGMPFQPDPSWLATHAIRSVLTLGFDDAGRTLAPYLKPLTGTTNDQGGG
jgi:hypothetical protein